MRRTSCPPLRIELALLVVLGVAWFAEPAFAHKVVVFGTGQGKAIEGEVYFHGGAPGRNVKVSLVDPDGRTVGVTTTDDEGRFRFPVQFRCDYKLIADAGEGHGAEYTVPADELPESLPPPGEPGGSPGGEAAEAKAATAAGHEQNAASPSPPEEEASPASSGKETAQPVAGAVQAEPNQTPGAAIDNGDLAAEIRALGRQLAALRNDLNKYENQTRFHDVLGSLGYIFGIMGVAFYFLGVRRKEKRAAEE
jgi:nickel transport protein